MTNITTEWTSPYTGETALLPLMVALDKQMGLDVPAAEATAMTTANGQVEPVLDRLYDLLEAALEAVGEAKNGIPDPDELTKDEDERADMVEHAYKGFEGSMETALSELIDLVSRPAYEAYKAEHTS